MDKRTYRFSVGVILLILSFAFLSIPSLLNIDAMIPFMFALVSFLFGLGFFFMGNTER
jgi:hypothetical protein